VHIACVCCDLPSNELGQIAPRRLRWARTTYGVPAGRVALSTTFFASPPDISKNV
jgi:hypothetical protein